VTLRRAPRELAKIQRGIAERNPAAPKAWRTGDVILDDDDIFRDGVNTAARREALSEPGGICLGGAAHERVRDKLDLAFEDMGEQSLKSIAHPICA
jgi:adenylate cyclase